MTRHGSLTILFITAERLVRADVRSGRRLSKDQVVEKPRTAGGDLSSAVEVALRLTSKRPRRVLLLATDLWTQTLSLPAATSAGMSEGELAQALAFESEPFSNISAFDSLGSCVVLPTVDEEQFFWFTQVPQPLRDEIDQIVSQGGGKLIGMAHPAGLPSRLAAGATAESAWRRVELWPECVVCLDRDPEGMYRYQILGSPPQPGTWERETEIWFEELENARPRETLVAVKWEPREAMAGNPEDLPLDLASGDVLRSWLAAWAAETARATPRVPLIRSVPKPISDRTRVVMAAGLGLLTLAGCVSHYVWATRRTEEIEARVTALQAPAKELSEAQKETAELEKRLTELQSQADAISADVTLFQTVQGAQRTRMSHLLAALSDAASDEFVLQAIKNERNGISVSGVCDDAQAADNLALTLHEKLGPLGLHVHVPEKEAKYFLPDGSPYVFHLLIQDIGDLTEMTPAPPKVEDAVDEPTPASIQTSSRRSI